jgi:NAD(P)-dependent dehydrogenase (short-subunit alcohol dehydrogenase family)
MSDVSKMPSMFDLSGQVAVITGSTKGIGKAIAARMAQHGAKVVVSSRKADVVEAVTAEINRDYAANGGEAIGVPANIGRRPECEALVAAALDKWGQINTFVANAAINPYYGPLHEIPEDAFAKIMSTNVQSPIWFSGLVCPHMAERGGGNFVVISSVGGVRGDAKIGAYCLSKAADMQLVRNMAVEWGRFNIRANCVAPALVKTDFARALWANPVRHETALMTYPLKRLGDPDDIAGMTLMLASRAGQWICGQTLIVDGGMMAGIGRFE